MAQMASIFPYGPPLGPPSHRRGDEEEKITPPSDRCARVARVITNSPIDRGATVAAFLNHVWMFQFLPTQRKEAALAEV